MTPHRSSAKPNYYAVRLPANIIRRDPRSGGILMTPHRHSAKPNYYAVRLPLDLEPPVTYRVNTAFPPNKMKWGL